MTPDRASLEAAFNELSDAELLRRLGSDELSGVAQDVALSEAQLRGLYLQALRESANGKPIEVAHGHGPLRICARFLMPLDAQVFAARLHAEGLAAQVPDVDTTYAVGAFMGAHPRGGMRVVVPESQLERARQILEKYEAGEYAIDENFDPEVD
jgi:hypothetical protein